MKYWEIIAANLSKAGWSWGCVSAVHSDRRTIFAADAHRDDGKRFIVRGSKTNGICWTGIGGSGSRFFRNSPEAPVALKQAFTVIQAPVVTPSRLHRLSRSK